MFFPEADTVTTVCRCARCARVAACIKPSQAVISRTGMRQLISIVPHPSKAGDIAAIHASILCDPAVGGVTERVDDRFNSLSARLGSGANDEFDSIVHAKGSGTLCCARRGALWPVKQCFRSSSGAAARRGACACIVHVAMIVNGDRRMEMRRG